ncbi:MAG: 1,4-alpha-glucan-branching enzyme, partial [Verrucomicrobiota bacterium]
MRANRPALPGLSDDPWLDPFRTRLEQRATRRMEVAAKLTGERSLTEFASGHLHFGLHPTPDGWVFRDWAPNAEALFLIGDFNNWEEHPDWALHQKA